MNTAPTDRHGHTLDLAPSDDVRNFDYPYKKPKGRAVGAAGDVFHGYGGVELYQDDIGACAGFSGAGWLAARGYPNIDDGTGFAIFNEARRRDEWAGESYDWTSINAVCKVLRALGIIKEWRWPTTWTAYVDAVRKYPVIRGWDWTDAMSSPSANGILDTSGQTVGGHATLTIGHLPGFGITANRNWWQRKPWQPWGHDGNFYVRLADDQAKFEQRPEAAALIPA